MSDNTDPTESPILLAALAEALAALPYKEAVEAAASAEAKRRIRAALVASGGKPGPAGEALGLPRREYYRELERHGITQEAEAIRAAGRPATRPRKAKAPDEQPAGGGAPPNAETPAPASAGQG